MLHTYIDAKTLLGIDPLCDEAFYNFEAGYAPYEKFYVGEREKIDLVMQNFRPNDILSGLEIKLTAIPDNTTKSRNESEWGAEIVIRPPTINFLACSICSNYDTPYKKDKLRSMLRNVPQINHWEEIEEVLINYSAILQTLMRVSSDMEKHQKPLILQPIWKTKRNKMVLCDDCLDVFVWSDLATLQMCCTEGSDNVQKLNRFHRTVIWIYKMLLDYVTYDTFDYKRITRFLQKIYLKHNVEMSK